MAFTKILSAGIDTTGSYTIQEINAVGVVTAGSVIVPDISTDGITPSHEIKIWPGNKSYSGSTNSIAIGGTGTLMLNTQGDLNVAIGNEAMVHNTSGDENVSIGFAAGSNITTSDKNVAVGAYAIGYWGTYTGNGNTAVGCESLLSLTTGDDNTAVGRNAGDGIAEGDDNVAIGAWSLRDCYSGNGNIAIGYRAGKGIDGSNNIIIGNNNAQNTLPDDLSSTVIISCGATERLRINSAGLVGIGTDDPSRKLSVNGVIESLGEVSAGSTSEGGQLMLRAPSQQLSGTKYRYNMDVNYGNTTFARPVGSEVNGIRFLREDDSDGANGIVLVSIGQDGIMSLPYLPCFRARHTNNALTTGTLVYNTVDTNIGSHYNNTNGRFTAPISGFYSFKAHTLIQFATGGEARMAFYKNGSNGGLGAQNIITKGANEWQTIHVNGDFYLNAGDYITVEMVQNPSTTYSDSNFNGFSGFLVG